MTASMKALRFINYKNRNSRNKVKSKVTKKGYKNDVSSL